MFSKFQTHTEMITTEQKVKIAAVIHPCESDAIIINYPGFNASASGDNDRYRTMAEFLSEREKLGAVVRIANQSHLHINYSFSVIDDLHATVERVLTISDEICGTKVPKLYLMGTAAGAGAVAAVAADFPQIQKILLIAPSDDADTDLVRHSLSHYTGEMYCAVGAEDAMVGPDAAQYFADMAPLASVRKVTLIPNCDHKFTGDQNGRILSALPLWSFGEKVVDPLLEHGIKPY